MDKQVLSMPLYQALARLLQWRNSLSRAPDPTRMLDLKAAIEDELQRLVKEHMPSGSGFDSGTTLCTGECFKAGDPRPGPSRLVFETSFHHMNDIGYYTCWTEHKVYVTPAFIGFDLNVTGRNKNGIKDYIGETFHYQLAGLVVVQMPVPKPQEVAP